MALVQQQRKANGQSAHQAAPPPAVPTSIASQQAAEAEVVIDALSYVDQEYAYEGYRDMVNKMVAAEMKTFQNEQNLARLPLHPLALKSPLLVEELARVEKGQPLPPIDTARYQLEPPTGSKRADIGEWTKAIQNSEAQLQHQSLRLLNLELMQKYGSNAWRYHNYQLEAIVKTLEQRLEDIQKQIIDLNKQRKLEQTEAFTPMSSLEQQWYDLVLKNAQIELAIAQLEAEVAPLRPPPPAVSTEISYDPNKTYQDEDDDEMDAT